LGLLKCVESAVVAQVVWFGPQRAMRADFQRYRARVQNVRMLAPAFHVADRHAIPATVHTVLHGSIKIVSGNVPR
jgi:hypothetical protein